MNTTLKTLTKYETINDETNGVVGDGHFSENAHKVLSEQLISIINDYDFSEEKCIYYFYYPLSSEIFNKLILDKWEVLSKSKSFFVFHFENDYIFRELLKKDPIYDFAEIYIYQI